MQNIGSKGRILVVDDEESICDVLEIVLTREGYEVQTASDIERALEAFQKTVFDVIIQDIRFGDTDGLELMHRFKAHDPEVLVLIITAYSTIEIAVRAMRLGAYAYIKKPFDNEHDILVTVNRAVQFRQLLRSMDRLNKNTDSLSMPNIIGNTPDILEVQHFIKRIAFSDSTVLIQGESGTGKELVARALHYSSSRAYEPFIAVNCGAFPENLLENELFGSVQGAFTGALRDKKGLLEVSDKGTFFLDEISELLPAMQVSLLRVIENKSFKPLGSTETKKVDMRFVTATNTNLWGKVQKGEFRDDLYYRLNVISINLPPLRERREDIPLLGGYFLSKYSKVRPKPVTGFTAEALDALMRYNWPGNIRELENVVQSAMTLAEGDLIKLSDLKINQEIFMREADKFDNQETSLSVQGVYLDNEVKKMETQYITQALRVTQGSLNQAAKLLNLTVRSLRYKIQKYGLNRKI
jgi:two-component system, NtrC family, response regulator PilR